MTKHLNLVWFGVVAAATLLVLLNPELLDRENLAAFIERFGVLAFIIFTLLSLTRAVLLIPSTPFVLAGALAFPDWPIAVFLVSLAGVFCGALLVRSFPGIGSYDERLRARYPKRIDAIRERMASPYAWWLVMGWSAFPLVPTDAICYVAGLAKMPALKMGVAVVIGAIPVTALYVFLGAELGALLFA